MAVVVQQTIPFPRTSLDLGGGQTSAWNDLLPLIRPTLEHRKLTNGQSILLDTAQLKPNTVRKVALVPLSNLPSVLLDGPPVSALLISSTLEEKRLIEEISAAVENDAGIIVVKLGRSLTSQRIANSVQLVETDSDLHFNHVFHILGTYIETSSPNLDEAVGLVECLQTKPTVLHSTFHEKTVDGKPALRDSSDPTSYENAASAVEKTLEQTFPEVGSRPTDGSVTYCVHYADVNGLSRLESYIIAQEIARVMEARSMPYILSKSTVTEHDKRARGFIISTCPVPSSFLKPQPSPTAYIHGEVTSTSQSQSQAFTTGTLTFDATNVRARLTAGCSALIAAESTITHYDEIVGDGDCGLTLRDGALKTQSFMDDADLSSLPTFLSDLVAHLETTMGGTSGALYCIFLTALSGALASETESFANALAVALAQLLRYTRARLGDRTLLDALMPFVETLVQTGDSKKAVEKAEEGVERTKELEAKLGRSTYLDDSATKGVPDPGAYGLLVLLKGLCEG